MNPFFRKLDATGYDQIAVVIAIVLAVSGAVRFNRWSRHVETVRQRNEFFRLRESLQETLDVASHIGCDACHAQSIRPVLDTLEQWQRWTKRDLGDIRVNRHMSADDVDALHVVMELPKHTWERVM